MKHPGVPTFVIAGQPNAGKTTLVSTLAGNDNPPISDDSPTTKELHDYTVFGDDGKPLLVFYDSPGFQNAPAVLEWFRENARHVENPAKAFLEETELVSRFPAEREILKEISQGAMAVYVADPSHSILEDHQLEVEILCLCKVPRIGAFSLRSGSRDLRKDWKNRLGAAVPVWHSINPWTADAEECIRFIERLKGVSDEWDAAISKAVEQLRNRWEGQLWDASKFVMEDFKQMILFEASIPFAEGDEESARRKAEAKLRAGIENLESGFRKRIRKLFKHSDERWRLPEELEWDLFANETWQLFGFSKGAIITASTIAGAGTGLLIDIATGGGTIGIGALIGGAAGFAAAFFGADRVADLRVVGKKLGGQSVVARIERRSKLPGTLLGRIAAYAKAVSTRPHGRRENGEDVEPIETFSKELERTGSATRLQGLVELWYRGKSDKSVSQSEEWLRYCVYDYLTKGRTTRDNPDEVDDH